MKSQIRIINSRQGFAGWLRSVASFMLIIPGPIAIGIITGSEAMQWFGFVMGMLIFTAYATSLGNVKTCKSIDEARAYLDELGKREAG